MSQLEYRGHRIESRPGETVLDACLRQGVDLHFSCRGGSCHNCLCQCAEGDIPARAQRGLAPRLAEKGYFLPCVCIPENDMRFVGGRGGRRACGLQSRECCRARCLSGISIGRARLSTTGGISHVRRETQHPQLFDRERPAEIRASNCRPADACGAVGHAVREAAIGYHRRYPGQPNGALSMPDDRRTAVFRVPHRPGAGAGAIRDAGKQRHRGTIHLYPARGTGRHVLHAGCRASPRRSPALHPVCPDRRRPRRPSPDRARRSPQRGIGSPAGALMPPVCRWYRRRREFRDQGDGRRYLVVLIRPRT